MIKIQGTPISFWERSIFSRGKSLGATPETPRFEHTQGIEPGTPGALGFQAGDLTTRLDLYGLGDGTILANLGKIIETQEMVK